MLKIVPSNQFKKDLKLARKRGCKIEHLRDVVNVLAAVEYPPTSEIMAEIRRLQT